MQIRPLFLFAMLVLALCDSKGQNFIPNPSFENYMQCPLARNDRRLSLSWDTPTSGTSDYFNSCASPQSELDVPRNFAGTQLARTGNAYAGFYVSQNFAAPFLEYREYMQVTLDSFLVAGGVYSFEMYVSLGDNSNFASNKIGAYISAGNLSAFTTEYLDYEPQIVSSGYVTDKTGWTRIAGTYVAQGGEHYITIGVFEPAATHTRIAVAGGNTIDPNYNGVSYYYLDDVSMTRACDLPSVLLRPDTSICAAAYTPVRLSALTAAAADFKWNTGNTSSSIMADTPGLYIINAKTPYCSVYDTVSITYAMKPQVSLGPDTVLCNRAMRILPSGSKGLPYRWSTASTDTAITVNTTGTYWVRVGSNTCYASDTVEVRVISIQPFDLGRDTVICSGQTARLRVPGNTGMQLLWNTNETTPEISVLAPGIYWAEIYSGQCSVKDSIEVTFEATPVISLGNDTALCLNEPYRIDASFAANYRWNDGTTAPSILVAAEGDYWVETRNGSCTARDTIRISRRPWPLVSLGSDRRLCKETAIVLATGNEPGTTYAWSTGSQAASVTVHAPGSFFVKAVNMAGCYAADTIVLDTFASPVVNLGNDSFMCEGRTFLIDAGDFSAYAWNTGWSQRTLQPETAGSYRVTVTDRNGCTAADSVSLLHYPKPTLHLVKELRICEPDTLITATSNAGDFRWNDLSALPAQRITTYGSYTVTVTDTNTCTNSATLEVISTCPGNVFVPNVFTPANQDGLNELFMPVVRNVRYIRMQIYTRWGELVYETEEAGKGWDGTFRNMPAQADVYVYKIDYTGFSGISKTLAGNVTLLK